MLVDPVGLNEGRGVDFPSASGDRGTGGAGGGDGQGEGGERTCLQINIGLQRAKKRMELKPKSGGEMYKMTPNAQQLVQIGPVRMLRLQMLHGLFAASYSKLGPVEAAALRAEVAAGRYTGSFCGLTLAATGFASWEENGRRAA